MTENKRKIYFVHGGRESYPEIAAYQKYSCGQFQSEEVLPSALQGKPDVDQAICWYIMGFHPRRPSKALVIHDYRSLSVGRFCAVKDKVKRHLNAKPDIRIFQNAEMQAELGLFDDVPVVYLPMGIPESILSFRTQTVHETVSDFCYIGVMSEERKTFLMLDSFLKRFGERKSFDLYGLPEQSIVDRYKGYKNIRFKGKLAQSDLFPALLKSRVAVNYFPNHRPHLLQTPTKLLEYAGLGLRILCNEHPRSRQAQKKYGINCYWGSAADMFFDVPDSLDWPDNHDFDPAPLLWASVIQESGVFDLLQKSGAR